VANVRFPLLVTVSASGPIPTLEIVPNTALQYLKADL